MAIYPCQRGNHRYAGPQRAIYLTWVSGNVSKTRKARLCGEHYQHYLQHGRDVLSPVDEGLQGSLVCERCDEPAQEILFATFYGGDGIEEPFAGDFCSGHAASALDRLGWPEMVPMR